MDQEVLGKCPLCKEGDIIEKEKNFTCTNAKWEKGDDDKWTNSGCTYSVYKFGLEKFGKPEITAEEIKTMLANGQVEIELKYTKKMVPDDKFGVKVLFKE